MNPFASPDPDLGQALLGLSQHPPARLGTSQHSARSMPFDTVMLPFCREGASNAGDGAGAYAYPEISTNATAPSKSSRSGAEGGSIFFDARSVKMTWEGTYDERRASSDAPRSSAVLPVDGSVVIGSTFILTRDLVCFIHEVSDSV